MKVTGVPLYRESIRSYDELLVRVESIESDTEFVPPEYARVRVTQSSDIPILERVSIDGVSTPNKISSITNTENILKRYETESVFFETDLQLTAKNISEIPEIYEPETLDIVLLKLRETRNYVSNIVHTYLRGQSGELATGILLGDADQMSGDTKQTMRDSGLIHIMVLSGANISIIIVCIFYLFSFLKPVQRITVSLLFSWIFILATGLTAPAVRAGVMVSVLLLSKLFGRSPSALHLLLLSLFILTLFAPESLIYSPSLHLSFIATFALMITFPAVGKLTLEKVKIKNKLYEKIFQALVLVIVMSLATVPYILSLTGNSSLVGSVLTILVEPLVLISMICSTLVILLHHISSALALLVGYFGEVSNSLILKIAATTQDTVAPLTLTLDKSVVIIYYIILISVSVYMYQKDDSDILSESTTLRL
jgi:ComEC/Rec2-related protein